jgi:hypothetical protein
MFPLKFATILACESFAGKRVRKTMVVLPITDASDPELCLGKVTAALFPAIGISWISYIFYTLVLNIAGYPAFDRIWYPPSLLTASYPLDLAFPDCPGDISHSNNFALDTQFHGRLPDERIPCCSNDRDNGGTGQRCCLPDCGHRFGVGGDILGCCGGITIIALRNFNRSKLLL